MILSGVIGAIFALFNIIIGFIPVNVLMNDSFDISALTSLISKAFVIFPYDLFILCLNNVTFWLTAHMLWAIIEWVYKKIPGVN